MRDVFIEASYLIASALFILGLRSLTRPDKARRGMQQAAVGMLFAIVGTLLNHTIVDYRWIAARTRARRGHRLSDGPVGADDGDAAANRALAHASARWPRRSSASPSITRRSPPAHCPHARRWLALGFEVMLGSITVGGTIVAAGKLQEWITSKPVTFPGQNFVNGAIFLGIVALVDVHDRRPVTGVGVLHDDRASLRVRHHARDADRRRGHAGRDLAAEFVHRPRVVRDGIRDQQRHPDHRGTLDGASGFILSMLMSKAMNRSFTNVLFGAFGSDTKAAARKTSAGLTVRSISVDDAAIQLAYAQLVIVIPGYGMAVAQAQHAVRELAELIEKRGGEVKFAIHPVAGRMPGHMNVLLAEANVPYDQLYDMDEINSEFDRVDVALVIGANDVVNPAARKDKARPIYGMPILNADHAKSVIVMKRCMAAGFAGIENDLFYKTNTRACCSATPRPR